ncbi:MAG: hypothetical protein ACI8TX_002438 [Hyphomicrobiaceae bacterium]|jgi:hypothetical protein
MKPSADHELPPEWEHYPNTILEIYRDGLLRVDLRLPVDESARNELSNLGLGPRFAIVTACNPHGRSLDAADTHRRIEALDTEIATLPCHFLRADGVSPDGQHRERGFAVDLPQKAAVELASRWQQAAIFWFDVYQFWIVAVPNGNGPAISLPLTALPRRYDS